MWAALIDYFQRFPAQEKIARLLIKGGLSIRDGGVYCGEIQLSDSALGRAAGVDRRIVSATVRTIEANPELKKVFTHFQPTLHLKDVAPNLGWGVIEIIPDNASRPGILAGVSSLIAREGISIRQAVVDDPERPVPASLIPELQRVMGVRSVTLS
jgi:uncharacterized protein